MTVKAVEMVRRIRDQNYEKTKNFTIEDQIKFIREKSNKLQKELCIPYRKKTGKILDK